MFSEKHFDLIPSPPNQLQLTLKKQHALKEQKEEENKKIKHFKMKTNVTRVGAPQVRPDNKAQSNIMSVNFILKPLGAFRSTWP